MSEPTDNIRIERAVNQHGIHNCKSCGNAISVDGISIDNRNGRSKTGYLCLITLDCVLCKRRLFSTWYEDWIDDVDQAIKIIERSQYNAPS